MLATILAGDEVITNRPSLGAGTDSTRPYDIETNQRVAEVKVSIWQKSANGGRQRSLFADVVGLSLDAEGRDRQVFVVGERPDTFLTASNRRAKPTRDKSAVKLRSALDPYPDSLTVSEFVRDTGVEIFRIESLLTDLKI